MYRKYIKRLLDLVFSTLLLVILLPLILLISFLVKVKLGDPIIFVQKRPGKHEKIFKMYKFRSMLNKKDKNGNLLADENRLTDFGKKMRSTSLDELPELINIIKGEMSFVGPRPLVVEYLPYYTEEERRRHSIRPGLTGLAQIFGRNYVTWEDRFNMDLQYVDNYSFIMDVKIVIKTLSVVFKRENIETASKIEHNGAIYRPLNIEREERRREGS